MVRGWFEQSRQVSRCQQGQRGFQGASRGHANKARRHKAGVDCINAAEMAMPTGKQGTLGAAMHVGAPAATICKP